MPDGAGSNHGHLARPPSPSRLSGMLGRQTAAVNRQRDVVGAKRSAAKRSRGDSPKKPARRAMARRAAPGVIYLAVRGHVPSCRCRGRGLRRRDRSSCPPRSPRGRRTDTGNRDRCRLARRGRTIRSSPSPASPRECSNPAAAGAPANRSCTHSTR